jgi:hypothetical protein
MVKCRRQVSSSSSRDVDEIVVEISPLIVGNVLDFKVFTTKENNITVGTS